MELWMKLTLALTLLSATALSNWTEVIQQDSIELEYNLAERPLHISTGGGSGDDLQLVLSLFSTRGAFITTVTVQFTGPPRYKVTCAADDWTDFPVDLPTELDKIWSLSMTDTSIVLFCNGVEVLRLVYSSQACARRWKALEPASVRFSTKDTVSNQYSQEPVCKKPEISNGAMNPAAPLILRGSAYTLLCNPGYMPSSDQTVLSCMEDGTLEGVLPACVLNPAEPEQVVATVATGYIVPSEYTRYTTYTSVIPFDATIPLDATDSSGYTGRLSTVMACTAIVLAAWLG